MRVIAGAAKGRKLRMKEGLPVRPTSDKVKGAVFNMLAPLLAGCDFLDLFAGSGAIGIEAWSRGARQVVFVEKDRRVFAQLKANLQMVGYADASCLLTDYRQALSRFGQSRFDIIYADPPYQAGYYQSVMDDVAALRLLRSGGALCLEHPRTWQLPTSSDWQLLQQKTYGDIVISILRCD